MVAKRETAGNSRPRRRPATTPEGREQQLGALAYDLAEKRLEAGTASASEVIYFLKANSIRERKELARLENDNLLTQAKISQAGQADRMEGLLTAAMSAFTEYKGGEVEDEDIDY